VSAAADAAVDLASIQEAFDFRLVFKVQIIVTPVRLLSHFQSPFHISNAKTATTTSTTIAATYVTATTSKTTTTTWITSTVFLTRGS